MKKLPTPKEICEMLKWPGGPKAVVESYRQLYEQHEALKAAIDNGHVERTWAREVHK